MRFSEGPRTTIATTPQAGNLLKPHVVNVAENTTRKWEVEGLKLEVSLAGGSRGDCESWFVTLRRVGRLSSH